MPGREALVQQFTVKETSDLRNVSLTGSGAVEIQPGETATLVEYEPQSDQAYLLALGATDHDNTEYELRFDHDRHGITRSPIGLVNSPFSFRAQLGIIPPVTELVEYRATLDSSASDAQTYAGRLYVTEADPRGRGGDR